MSSKKLSVITVFVSLVILLSLIGTSCSRYSSRQAPVSYKDLTYPALGDIRVPDVKRVKLANGIQLFLLEDHELPLIRMSAMIRTGSVYEPSGKVALADIAGTVMRSGGTTSRTGDQIDEQLEQIAASVETGIGLNSGSASVSVLKEDIGTGLAILADVLMNPAFPEDKIELAKIQHRSSISRRNDNLRWIAGRQFNKIIYGPQSVYARQTEYATIDNITRDDLVAFHNKFYRPNNMMLAVWGDFDIDRMIAMIEKAFGGWEKGDVEIPAVPKVQYEFKPTVNLVRKDDINQACIRLGHIGGFKSDPDYFTLLVMNRALSDRVFKNVRSREGLAYSAYADYGANYDHPGVFMVLCQTKSEATVHAVRAMIREVRKITESEITNEELILAKEGFLNSFVFNFESKGQIVRRLMTLEYFGYPADFLQKTKASVEKVTKADVLRVAKKHLRPDNLQILAVGKADDFDEPLSVFGSVNEIDITIPPPQQ